MPRERYMEKDYWIGFHIYPGVYLQCPYSKWRFLQNMSPLLAWRGRCGRCPPQPAAALGSLYTSLCQLPLQTKEQYICIEDHLKELALFKVSNPYLACIKFCLM